MTRDCQLLLYKMCFFFLALTAWWDRRCRKSPSFCQPALIHLSCRLRQSYKWPAWLVGFSEGAFCCIRKICSLWLSASKSLLLLRSVLCLFWSVLQGCRGISERSGRSYFQSEFHSFDSICWNKEESKNTWLEMFPVRQKKAPNKTRHTQLKEKYGSLSWLWFKCVNSLSFIFHCLLPVLWFWGLYFISCLDIKAFSTCVLRCFKAPPFVLFPPPLIALMCFTCVLLMFPCAIKSI